MRPDMELVMGRWACVARSWIAATSDAMAVRGLSASETEVTRMRLALEDSQPMALGGDAVLTPSLELGVCLDGGRLHRDSSEPVVMAGECVGDLHQRAVQGSEVGANAGRRLRAATVQSRSETGVNGHFAMS